MAGLWVLPITVWSAGKIPSDLTVPSGTLGRVTVPALNLEDFEFSVRPQDDLFRFANGSWLASTEIPEDKSAWGAFQKLREDSDDAVHKIVGSLRSDDLSTLEGKITALYTSFMDEEAIERLDAKPLNRLLAMIDGIDTTAGLAHYLGWATRHGVLPLFDFDVDADPGNPSRYLVFMTQGGLGLPDEAYYREEQHAQVREQYLAHLEDSLALAGFSDAKEQATTIFDLETRIAAHHWDNVRTRDLVAMYNLRTWQEFTAASPQLQWGAYLTGAGISEKVVSEVVSAQPSFFEGISQLWESEPLSAWRSWARFHLISFLSPLLSSRFVDQNFKFYSNQLSGTPVLRPRWKRGAALVESVMGEGIGRIYVERHFPPQAKERMDILVANLLEAYRRSITSLGWMGEQTREEALRKLSKFRPKIGHPTKWRDYSALIISPDDLVGNILRAASFGLDYRISKMDEPVDPDEWLMYPQTVNAYYHPLRNEIAFPAAILQPPFFNLDADDPVNYGGIGAVIGHEIGHGFDDKGSTCDGDGRLRDWWSAQDRAAFEERTKALIEQYNVLSPEGADGRTVNGELTIGENIGDLGGLSIAYQAWLLSGGDPAGDPIDGFTPAQRFFLGWAAVWQAKSRDELVVQRLATDPHSPAEFRCNQIVRNVDAFYEAFGVKEQDRLWLPPEERVQIW